MVYINDVSEVISFGIETYLFTDDTKAFSGIFQHSVVHSSIQWYIPAFSGIFQHSVVYSSIQIAKNYKQMCIHYKNDMINGFCVSTQKSVKQ